LGCYEELIAMVGRDQPDMIATDEVCPQMIRHWCEAMEDANPLYTDEEYARQSKYRSIIAPPPMIWSWVIPPLWPPSEPPKIWRDILRACAQGGFEQIVDTDVDMEFYRPLRPGDRVTAAARLYDVSKEKQTRLGRGHFVTVESAYRNQDSQPVCRQRVTLFIYRASAGRAE
jgi:acyl dehydratase